MSSCVGRAREWFHSLLFNVIIASSCIFIVGVCFTGKIIISISSLHEKITKIIDTVYRAVNFKMKNTSD
jgi:hypothetical protein